MAPERLEQLKLAFQHAFGIPFERGIEEVRFLTRNYTSMAKMNGPLERAALSRGLPIPSATVSMSERDFAMIAFFALMGLETGLGTPIEEQPEPVDRVRAYLNEKSGPLLDTLDEYLPARHR